MIKKGGDRSLCRNHSYYYQVQAQINVCNVEFGDFVVWTKDGIAVERIAKDSSFYESTVNNIEHVFKYGILPEIVGKWSTRTPVSDTSGVVHVPQPHGVSRSDSDDVVDDEDPDKCWCFCEQPSYGNMICCEHNNCTIKWFHFDCLRICCPPKGRWLCPSCRKLPKERHAPKSN